MIQKETEIKELTSLGHNTRSLIDPMQVTDVVGRIEANTICPDRSIRDDYTTYVLVCCDHKHDSCYVNKALRCA